MHLNKYYNLNCHRDLKESDGCKFEDWAKETDTFLFALHPKGFLVFLPPFILKDSDEYLVDDPYTVETNLKNQFHRRRIDSTIYLLNLALDKNNPNPKILDIGCGKGYITAEIQKNFLNAEISGLDYSVSAISYAKDNFQGIDFCVADAYSPPYCSNYFDAVLCNNLWEHVPEPLRLLNGINRVLKKGGFLIISTPNRYRLYNLLRVMRGKPTTLYSIKHVTEYSVGQVIDLLQWGNFEVRKVYSKPIRSERDSIKTILLDYLIMPIMGTYLKILKSRHILESTVFFLAKKSDMKR